MFYFDCLQRMWWEVLKVIIMWLFGKLTLWWRQVTQVTPTQAGVNRLSRRDYGSCDVSAGYGLLCAKMEWGQAVDTHSTNDGSKGKSLKQTNNTNCT